MPVSVLLCKMFCYQQSLGQLVNVYDHSNCVTLNKVPNQPGIIYTKFYTSSCFSSIIGENLSQVADNSTWMLGTSLWCFLVQLIEILKLTKWEKLNLCKYNRNLRPHLHSS